MNMNKENFSFFLLIIKFKKKTKNRYNNIIKRNWTTKNFNKPKKYKDR